MTIEKDKYLCICSVICGLLFVYFTSVYILLVIVVFISYLYYVSDPTTFSFKLRIQKQMSNLWSSSSLLTSFDSMYQQNSLAAYRLNRDRTFSNPHRSSNTISFRENDAENTSIDAYRREHDSKSFNYRSSDDTMFSNFKLNSHTSNRSLNTTRRSTPPNSPWGISVSPKLRNHTSEVKTVQTVAGPLLASTRFNRSFDSGLFGNISSPGLSSRIAHSARENAEVLTHQKKYDRPGDFPLVQLDRSAAKLPTLSPRNTHKLSRTPVTVRIAPPESSELRYSALLDRSPQSLGGMDYDTSPTADQSTKSLLEVLKEISRKRIHSQMEENEDEVKRQCKGETSLANGEQQSRLTPVVNDVSGCKRMREESPEDQNGEQTNCQSRKRFNNNNEILSSLSSSRNLLKFMKKSAKKRKSTAELLANSAPVAKKQSRRESPSEPVFVSAGDTTPNSDKQNTPSAAAVNSATSSSKSTSTTKMSDSVKFSEIIQMNHEKPSQNIISEEMAQQHIESLLDSIKNKDSTTRSSRFSLSRAPTLPVRRIPLSPEDKIPEITKISSDDSKKSNTLKDSNISITKSPSSADVFGLVSLPSTTLLCTSTTSVVSVSAPIVHTSTTQSAGSATPGMSSSPFSGLASPALVASSLNTSLKASADQLTASSEQPTTKANINNSPSFATSISASNVNPQTFSISLPTQSSTNINFGTIQTTAAMPNSLSSVKSSIFATNSAEQPIQTPNFSSSTNAPSNQTSAVQLSTSSTNNKTVETITPSSPQSIFGATSSAKDTIIGSSQLQSTQASTFFSPSQVQPTQTSSIFGSSPVAQSTRFTPSPQVQPTQATIAFGSSPTQPNPVFPVSNSSVQANTESGCAPSVQPKSLFSLPQTSQQTSTGSVFPSVQSTAVFGTSSSSSLQPQTALPFGGSATAEPAQTNVFGSKQMDLFKTSSANQQAGKLFGTSSSVGVQPAQTATVFSTSPASTVTQASVFGSSGTTQTTAGSNVFGSSGTTQTITGSNVFGGSGSTQTTAGSNVFGSSGTTQTMAGSNVFGSSGSTQTTTGSNVFGSSGSTQTTAGSNVFGSSGSTQTTPGSNVFGSSGTQTMAGSNAFGSTSVVSSTQSEVKFAINTQSSSTMLTKPSFVLPSASIAFGSSLSPAQNTGGFQVAKPTSDSGVGTSAASSGFGSVGSKPSSAQNTFSFGGTLPSTAASQTAVFGTPTSLATPKPTTQTSLSFGTSTLQSSGTFGTSQAGTAISGGFGAFSGSVAKTTENNAATGKNMFASAASGNTAANNTPVFGTQITNTVSLFGGSKTDEKPTPFGFGNTKPSEPSTNIFQSNTTSNQSNAGGFKFDFTSSATTKENTAGTSSGQTSTPAFQFGAPGESKPAFGFGSASNVNNTLKPAAGGFGNNLFGSTPTTTSSTTPQSNVFAFGGGPNPSSGPATSTNNAFAFGAGSSAPSTSGAFTFGSTSQPSSSNVFGFGSAQTTTSTAQNVSGGGGVFNTAASPAFQFGGSSNQAVSTGSFGFGSPGTSSAPLNFTAGPSSSASTFQPASTGGFGFGSSGTSATPLNFTAGPSTSSNNFQPGTTGNMFSIGSGSTGPRARARASRRQR